VHALHDPDAVHHGPSCPIPLGDHEHVARAELINGLLQFCPALEAFAGGLLRENAVAPLGAQCTELRASLLMRD
jgi:hypothetical protein